MIQKIVFFSAVKIVQFTFIKPWIHIRVRIELKYQYRIHKLTAFNFLILTWPE